MKTFKISYAKSQSRDAQRYTKTVIASSKLKAKDLLPITAYSVKFTN